MAAINTSLSTYHTAALDRALKAANPAEIDGISCYGPGQPILMWLQGQPASISPANQAAVQAIFDNHDPVFVSVDKTQIAANGIDAATFTISAPKQGAAPVILSVAVNGGAPTDWSIPLTNGQGGDTLTSVDPATITVSVKNPGNRSIDTIIITAR